MTDDVDVVVSARATISVRGDDVFVDDLAVERDGDVEPVLHAKTLARRLYVPVITHPVEHLAVVCGAGSSVGVGVGDRLGQTMPQLWTIVEKTIDLPSFCELVKYDLSKRDLEALLTQAHRASGLVEGDVSSRVEEIEQIIQEHCSLQLPEHAPHEAFLGKLVRRPLKYPRVRLFTLNYDTLFEQAANRTGITLIDGFSFNSPRVFSGAAFDYDIVLRHGSRIAGEANYLNQVVHLYKLHGSIDWCEDDESRIAKKEGCERPLMIFPRDTKFEHSYKQPFFEMFSRLQQTLRASNVLVICLGTSFGDSHIFTALKEAVSQNQSAQLLVVNRSIGRTEPWQWLRRRAQTDNQVILVAEDFEAFVEQYPALSIGHGRDGFWEAASDGNDDEP